jgi:hypothetical protein
MQSALLQFYLVISLVIHINNHLPSIFAIFTTQTRWFDRANIHLIIELPKKSFDLAKIISDNNVTD